MTVSYVVPPPELVSIPVQGGGEFPIRRIYCVGRNYIEHIREMGGDERSPPFFFQKPRDSLILTGARIAYPTFTQDFQFELELVLAIGVSGANIAPEDAAGHVFGLAVGVDLTRRDVQVQARKTGRPWEIGKSFDHSAPCGHIIPLRGTTLPTSGQMTLSVNGVERQRGDLSQMIWAADEIISQLSKQYRLEPGDLIYTGTPAGIGPLLPGDALHAQIAGAGELEFSVDAPRALSSA